MPKVQQPVFPAYEVNISKFGAKEAFTNGWLR